MTGSASATACGCGCHLTRGVKHAHVCVPRHDSPVPGDSTPTGTGDTNYPTKKGSGLVDHAGTKPGSGAPWASAHP